MYENETFYLGFHQPGEELNVTIRANGFSTQVHTVTIANNGQIKISLRTNFSEINTDVCPELANDGTRILTRLTLKDANNDIITDPKATVIFSCSSSFYEH